MTQDTAAEVQAWRERLGLTQKAAAEVLGADKGTLWRWENRRSTPPHPTMLRRAMNDYEREVTDG